MKKYFGIVAFMVLAPTVFADDMPMPPPPMVLDKISFQVASKQWVTTKTALLGVSINVTLNNADLVQARNDIMSSLNKIAKGEWHITEFDRSQDSSGLEKLYVQAQARIDQSLLTDIYKNAKTVSMPGAKFEVSTIEFKPSLEEVQAIRAQVREQLYQKVNDELTRMNKAYPMQKYTINYLVFAEGDNPSVPSANRPQEYKTMELARSAAPIAVSNEIIMTAIVEAASNRKEGN